VLFGIVPGLGLAAIAGDLGVPFIEGVAPTTADRESELGRFGVPE
jgi:hypothetical protein